MPAASTGIVTTNNQAVINNEKLYKGNLLQ